MERDGGAGAEQKDGPVSTSLRFEGSFYASRSLLQSTKRQLA